MEILNNLWLAVSTPNEGLLNVITIPIFLIEAFLTMNLFLYVIGLSSTKKQRIVYLFSTSIVCIFTMFIIPNPFNIFVNYFMIIFLGYAIFKNSLLKSITSSVLSLIIYNSIGVLILNPFLTLLHITSEQLNVIPMYRLLYLFAMYLITFLLVIILKNRKSKFDFLEEVSKKEKLIIFSNLFFGILAIIIQSIILFYYVDKCHYL